MKVTKSILQAEAQILGFHHRNSGYSMRDLCSSMGLEKQEWEVIKKEMNVEGYLPKVLVDEIEEYLEGIND